MTISQSDFFNLAEVKACQEIQKRNPFGSRKDRDATIKMREIAAEYGVEEHFDTAEDYDEDVKHIKAMKR